MSNRRDRRGSFSQPHIKVEQPQPQPRERRNSVSFQLDPVVQPELLQPDVPVITPVITPVNKQVEENKIGIKSLSAKIDNIKSCECDSVKSTLLSDAQNRQKSLDLYKASTEKAISNLEKQVEYLSNQLRELIEN